MNAPVPQVAVAGARIRQLPLLVRPYLRAVRWQPSLGAAALAALLVGWKADDLAEPGTGTLVLRGVAVLLGLGAAFLLDDAAADTLASSPTSLAWRRSSRLVVAAALAGVPWVLAVVWVDTRAGSLPIAGLSIEFTAMLALALAAAAGIARWTDTREPGVLAAPVTSGLVLVIVRLPERWALLVGPGPMWAAAHQRWTLVLVTAVLLLLWCNRDPARTAPVRVTAGSGAARHGGVGGTTQACLSPDLIDGHPDRRYLHRRRGRP
ncbi:hypothetical protein [Blastococcus deserti]|uniref:ABC transporter n=1 Tax=Blastococcus deserti TaxID=2259033 RepID=A0ABW4XG70_9ACTN